MSLSLITAPTEAPITLAEAKLHLRVDSTDEDTLIESLIDAAVGACEHELGRALMPQVWEVTLDAFPRATNGAAIELAMPPVRSVASVKYVRDSDGAVVTVAGTDYTLDAALVPGWVLPVYGKTWPTDARAEAGAVRVQINCGWANAAAVPAPIKAWLLLAVGQMYRHREAGAEARAVQHEFVRGLLDRWRVHAV